MKHIAAIALAAVTALTSCTDATKAKLEQILTDPEVQAALAG